MEWWYIPSVERSVYYTLINLGAKVYLWITKPIHCLSSCIPIQNNKEDEYSELYVGVLQGSVLGPILYILLFISNLPKMDDVALTIFADDTNRIRIKIFRTNCINIFANCIRTEF